MTALNKLESMQRGISLKALNIGVGAFLINLLVFIGSGGSAAMFGNVLLFMASSILPLPSVLAACAAAITPFWIIIPSTILDQLHVIIVCITIRLAINKWPHFPIYLTGLMLWVFIFWPFYFFVMPNRVWNAGNIVSQGFTEIFLIYLAGALLLSPTVRNQFCEKTKEPSISSILSYAFVGVAFISMIGVFAFFNSADLADTGLFTQAHNIGLLIFCISILITTAYLGRKLAFIFRNATYEEHPKGMLGLSQGFSGLSSSYWRRQQEQKVRQNTEAIAAKFDGLSELAAEEASSIAMQNIPTDIGVCVLSKNCNVIFMNRKFRQYCGIKLDVVNGKPLDVLGIDPSLYQHILNLTKRTLCSGPEIAEIKLNQLPHKLRFFEISSRRGNELRYVKLENEKDAIVVLMRDITERRTIEANLLKAQKLESLGIMVKGLALSFNNALSIILGQACLAREAKKCSTHIAALSQVAQTASRSSLITHQLIEFAADQPVSLDTCELCSVLANHIALLQSSIGEDYRISFESSHQEIFATVDIGLLSQALTNVLLNAKEALPNNSGEILVSLGTEIIEEEIVRLHAGTHPGNFARIRVQDKGIGMTPEALEKAFDPLFTTKSVSGHAGLGLSSVFAIMRAHDGFLTVESHPGKGTSVSMYLPLQSNPTLVELSKPQEITTQFESTEILKGSGEKVLILQEDPFLSEIMRNMSEYLGYSCICAQRSADILSDTISKEIDLIIFDKDNARTDADLLLNHSHENGIKTAAIGSRVVHKYDSAPSTYLQKPFSLAAYARFIQEALQQKNT